MPGTTTSDRSLPSWDMLAWTWAGMATLLVGAVQQGGIAGPLLATLVAAVCALPLALWLPTHPTRAWSASTEAVVRPAAFGAALATTGASLQAPPGGLPGWVLLALAVAALHLGVRPAAWRRRASVGVPVLGGLASALFLLPMPPPWTLLSPRWISPVAWGPVSVVLGFSLVVPALHGAGRGATPRRTAQRASFRHLGASLLLLAALLVVLGSDHAASHLANAAATSWAPHHAVVALAALALAASLGAVDTPGRVASLVPLTLWTGWFALAGPPAVAWMWMTLLPLGLGGALARVAWHAQGGLTWAAGGGAILLGAAAVVGFPGIPTGGWEAFGAAATVLLLVITVQIAGSEEAP